MQLLGQKVTYRKLNDREYLAALAAKLQEEAGELKTDDKEEAIKELADVLEVIDTLVIILGTDIAKVRKVQAERKAKRGGFAKRLYVERLDLQDDDPWADYYAKEPERFKEIKE